MARGKSGRIVLEVDPEEKKDLYEALEQDGLTLKHWFLERAREYLQHRNQTEMFRVVAEPAASYRATGRKDNPNASKAFKSAQDK